MKFVGEHLLPGQIGHLFVIVAFIASLISSISYFSAVYSIDETSRLQWKKIARFSFFTQIAAVIIVFSIIYYICANHFYEYMYAYKHASKELEPKFLLACIWEGQEGSFLLWTICNSILGAIFIFRGKEWESPVMGVVTLSQFFLFMMVLGIYFFGVRIGSSPFALTRNEISAPIFSQPNYLSFISDGMGLNVLLRNYWMVVHPPVLFLGFASTTIPFAFAISGMLTRKYGDWIPKALPWILFSACALGTGIMMGGKWAYESLSFGGYWAWDPVENSSLVPWLIMVAGLHTLLIYKATGRSLRATYFFLLLAFCFVLYSTFLTRTGILGDTSVHAFTEAGTAISVMIKSFLFTFLLGGMFLFAKHYKKIPAIHTEEPTQTREFWMFIGSLVIFLAAIFIISITSIPVYNRIPGIKDLIIKIHGGALAMPEDPEFVYNKVMVLVAIVIGLLTAITQYFKFKSTPKGFFIKKIATPTLISALITICLAFIYPLEYNKFGLGFLGAIYLAFFSTIYAFVANLWYIFSVQKANWKKAGGSIAHAGFALMLIGMIISSSNKKVISSSLVNGITFNMGAKDPNGRNADDPQENLTLIRQVPTKMADYEVTYTNDSAGNENGRKYYHLWFEKKDKQRNKIKEKFMLQPDVYLMKDNNMSSNPDTRNYLTRDIFTYVSFALKEQQDKDTAAFRESIINIGDTIFYSNGYLILNSILKNPNNGKYHFTSNDVALAADLTVVGKDSIKYAAMPALEVDNDHLHHLDDTIYAKNLYVRFNGISEDQKIKIGVKESDRLIDFVTVKTYVFPYINLVWLGIVIMCIGFIVSMIHRAKMSRMLSALIFAVICLGIGYMFLLANN